MKLYRLEDECYADDIIKRHGFVNITPDESLCTAKIWEKDGGAYKFTGWENTPETALMAKNPKYINIEQVGYIQYGVKTEKIIDPTFKPCYAGEIARFKIQKEAQKYADKISAGKRCTTKIYPVIRSF